MTKLIDLRKLRKAPGKDLNEPSATAIGYELESDNLDESHAFQRDVLTQEGWKILEDKVEKEYSYGSIIAEKAGCAVTVSVVKDPNTKRLNVFVSNMGNIDARLLPRQEDWSGDQIWFHRATFNAKGSLEQLAGYVREEFTKLGYREVVPYGGQDPQRVEGKVEPIGFLQKGIQINVTLEIKEAGSEVTYSVHVLQTDLPILAKAKGKIEFMDSPSYLFYDVDAGADKVFIDLKQELQSRGYSIGEGVKPKSELKIMNYPVTKEGFKPLKLSIIDTRQGKQTSVLFSGLGN
jgi:hypothetical protein